MEIVRWRERERGMEVVMEREREGGKKKGRGMIKLMRENKKLSPHT